MSTEPRALFTKTVAKHPLPWRVAANEHTMGWAVVDAEGTAVGLGFVLRETADLVALLPSLVDYTLDCAIERWVEER